VPDQIIAGAAKCAEIAGGAASATCYILYNLTEYSEAILAACAIVSVIVATIGMLIGWVYKHKQYKKASLLNLK
jgi:hypothetical protein